jgi:ribosomal protein S18 acetylase RimI-like enzyme
MKKEFIINNFKIKTRKCRKSDYNFVFGLIKKSIFPYISKYFKPSKEMFDERFKEDYDKRVILLRGKRRIGFYQLTVKKDKLDITGIFLTPMYQNKHIGSFLMNYFEKLGYKTVTLQVWENNPAFKFYKKLGYKVVLKKNHKYHMEKIVN